MNELFHALQGIRAAQPKPRKPMPYANGNISVLVADQQGRKFLLTANEKDWVPLEKKDVGVECVPMMLLYVSTGEGRVLFQIED